MAGPVEVKPFENAVRAERGAGAEWHLVDEKTGERVATVVADQDRVVEIMQLVCDSTRQPEDHAYPHGFTHKGRYVEQNGLTKREWFAGQAVVGLYQFISDLNSVNDIDTAGIARIAAETAFLTADAMVDVGASMGPQALARHIAAIAPGQVVVAGVDAEARG